MACVVSSQQSVLYMLSCLVFTEQDQCNTLCERHVLCTLSKVHALHERHCMSLRPGQLHNLQ